MSEKDNRPSKRHAPGALPSACNPKLAPRTPQPEAGLLGHHLHNGLLQSIDGQFKHGKNFTDGADGAGVVPHSGWYGIEPDGMGKGFGDEV